MDNIKINPLRWLKKEEERTIRDARHGDKKTFLSKNDALMIALVALASVFLSVWTKVMVLARYSTFENNDAFIYWHPITPWLVILGSILYVVACWSKGIRYWLVYAIPAFAIAFYIVQIALINSWIPPQALEPAVGWLAQYEWIIGKPVS